MRVRQKTLFLHAILAASLLALVSAAAGCASERDPVSQVQPNVLSKSFFVGEDLKSTADDPEFYAQGTVIDVGTFGSTHEAVQVAGAGGQPTSRIRWDISENMLFARLSFERIGNTDGKGKGKSTTGKQDGQIIAAYKIESHFDVRRDYNRSTGEETNVIIEDSNGRPWYDRESMRVDFSRNMVTTAYDFDTLAKVGIYSDGVEYESVAYEVTDPGSLDAPRYLPGDGYLDITNKVLAKSKMVELHKWGIDGEIPACQVPALVDGTEPAGNCNPAELTIRQSFRRVDANDYEPADWDGIRFQAFGAFTERRRGYDLNYGMTDEKSHDFIQRYDLWERSHYYQNPEAMTGELACNVSKVNDGADPNADDDKDGTADACSGVTQATGFAGSQCDVFRQKCTLPYRARVAKTLQWYNNVNSPEQYFEASGAAAHEWDVALRSAIQVARNAECHATDKADCDSRFPAYGGQMDAHEDAEALTTEVDLCRVSGKTDADCNVLADKIGQARGYDVEIIALAKMPEQVVFCHSPVEANDPAACGDLVSPGSKERRRLPAGLASATCRDLLLTAGLSGDKAATRATCEQATLVRTGDLRYHQINNIAPQEVDTTWGIMTDSTDPLDGRKVAGTINVFTALNTWWAQGLVDKLRYGKGELSAADIIDGKQIKEHSAFATRMGESTQAPSSVLPASSYPRLSQQEVNDRLGQAGGVATLTPALEAAANSNPAVRAMYNKVQALRSNSEGVSGNLAGYKSRLAALSGTGDTLSSVEAQLVTPAMQQYAQGALGQPLPSLSMASSTRGLNPTIAREMRRARDNGYAKDGTCVMTIDDMASAADPTSNVALATALERKFGAFNPADPVGVQNARAARMVDYVARRAQYAVIAHEMGHSVGLRHNFVSSADALNYRPQYWQLRTHDGRVTKACTGLQADGKDCVGPRYYDAVDGDENEGLIHMWMQSSVMDYAGEVTQDFLGIGAYDFAAARMFYGDAVGVYKDPSYAKGQSRGDTALDKMDSFGGLLGLQYQQDKKFLHYSELQNAMSLINDCKEVDPMSFKPSNWNEAKDGTFDATLDGHIVKVDGKYTRCKTQPQAFRRWTALEGDNAQRGARGGVYDAATKAVRVPYGFATDHWADLGNSSVYRHDNGADQYELFSFFIGAQETGHIFGDYRRGRQTFDVSSSPKRNLKRYNEKMRDAAKGLALFLVGDRTTSRDQMFAYANTRDAALASGMAFDYFTSQMARPQSGPHKKQGGIYRADSTGRSLLVPDGSYGAFGSLAVGGRLLENQLLDKGDYSTQYRANSGSYYDKVNVAMLMSESEDHFVLQNRDDYFDRRTANVSLVDVFPEGFRRFLGNAMTGDDFIKGVRVASDVTGVATVDGTTKFPAKGLGFTSWWRNQPTPCFPGEGSLICASPGAQERLNPQAPANMAVIDPQIGYEQQKFLWAHTLVYLLENEQRNWFNQMALYSVGHDSDPNFASRIELHDPTGVTYVAQSFGTESIYGKTVQSGIAARMLQYANELLLTACGTANLNTVTGQSAATWYTAKLSASGAPTCNTTSAAYYTFNDYVGLLNFANDALAKVEPRKLEKKD